MKSAIVVAIGLMVSVSAASGAQTSTKTFAATDLREIQIATEVGSIEVQRHDAPEVVVTLVVKDVKKCTITMQAQNDVLILRAESAGGSLFKSSACEASFSVRAPVALALVSKTGAGTIAVSDREGPVTLTTGSGDIRLNDVAGALMLKTGGGAITGNTPSKQITAEIGSGDMSLTGLRGSVDARTGSGNVALIWAQAPQNAVVKVSTGSGNAMLTFPADAKLTTSFSSGSGRMRSDFGEAQGGGVQVSVKTGSGDLTIKRSG